MVSKVTPSLGKIATLQAVVQTNRRQIGYLSAGLATASGTFSIISSATQQLHALTIGFGIGAGFCSLVAGSIGFYEQISKQACRKKSDPDPERGRDSIELRVPKAIDFVHDPDVPVAVSSGVEQPGLRSRRSHREVAPSSKPYSAARPSGSNTKRRRPKHKKPLQVSVAHFKSMQDIAGTTNLRDLALLPELAQDIAQIAETAKTNKGILQSLAKEASALAQAAVDLCQQKSDSHPLQSDIDALVQALRGVREIAVARNALEPSPVGSDIDRPILQAYRGALIIARRQLTRASPTEELGSLPRPSSSASSDTDSRSVLTVASESVSNLGLESSERQVAGAIAATLLSTHDEDKISPLHDEDVEVPDDYMPIGRIEAWQLETTVEAGFASLEAPSDSESQDGLATSSGMKENSESEWGIGNFPLEPTFSSRFMPVNNTVPISLSETQVDDTVRSQDQPAPGSFDQPSVDGIMRESTTLQVDPRATQSQPLSPLPFDHDSSGHSSSEEPNPSAPSTSSSIYPQHPPSPIPGPSLLNYSSLKAVSSQSQPWSEHPSRARVGLRKGPTTCALIKTHDLSSVKGVAKDSGREMTSLAMSPSQRNLASVMAPELSTWDLAIEQFGSVTPPLSEL
ncbi:hypothetical protein V5O48_005961 [Marasmius crinis-equi]|uniref:Uncharacterized protein n=1 Tax=Marasmius crinis-equi TaxID=585013 RepID=A0ABR3FLP8_9AGAR